MIIIIAGAIVLTLIISAILLPMKMNISPKSAFLHLFMIAMLYAVVIATVTLLFQYVNLVFPDPLNDFPYVRTQIFNSINWASAVLIIAYPVFVWTSWKLEKFLREKASNREVPERRWLLHLTLFVTGITIIIDLMVLVYNFYGGDLTTRFGLKVLAVLLVAGVALGYYQWDLHRGKGKTRIPMIMAILVGLLLLVAIVTGFFIGASPAEQRNFRFDERRVNDLQSIQGQLIAYWQNKGELPDQVSAVEDSISGYVVPEDPQTKTAYEYNKTGDHRFELCATFASESPKYEEVKDDVTTTPAIGAEVALDRSIAYYPGDPYGQNWLHPEGRFCFEREIDPDLYKPTPRPEPLSATDTVTE